MATTTTSGTLSMKLLIDTTAQRVLFAESGKDVVDILCSLLALPVATAVKLVGEESIVGSVGSLYASVENLDSTYVLPGADKGALLRPAVVSPAAATNSSLLRLPEPAAAKPKILYRCTSNYSSSCDAYVSDLYGTACPCCKTSMKTAAKYLQSTESGQMAKAGAKGLVQGIVTYTVRDDLAVTPMSAISSITMLNAFAVTDLSALREKTVQLGYAEGVEILKASLQSKTVLTDVFIRKK